MRKKELEDTLKNMNPQQRALFITGLKNKALDAIEKRKKEDPNLELRIKGVLPPDVDSILAEFAEIIGDYTDEVYKDDLNAASN